MRCYCAYLFTDDSLLPPTFTPTKCCYSVLWYMFLFVYVCCLCCLSCCMVKSWTSNHFVCLSHSPLPLQAECLRSRFSFRQISDFLSVGYYCTNNKQNNSELKCYYFCYYWHVPAIADTTTGTRPYHCHLVRYWILRRRWRSVAGLVWLWNRSYLRQRIYYCFQPNRRRSDRRTQKSSTYRPCSWPDTSRTNPFAVRLIILPTTASLDRCQHPWCSFITSRFLRISLPSRLCLLPIQQVAVTKKSTGTNNQNQSHIIIQSTRWALGLAPNWLQGSIINDNGNSSMVSEG